VPVPVGMCVYELRIRFSPGPVLPALIGTERLKCRKALDAIFACATSKKQGKVESETCVVVVVVVVVVLKICRRASVCSIGVDLLIVSSLLLEGCDDEPNIYSTPLIHVADMLRINIIKSNH